MANELVEIPKYSLSDFENSDAPFEFLSQYSDDPFIQERLVQRMKDEAAAVGFRSFMRMWNAYNRSAAKKSSHSLVPIAGFENIPGGLELQTESYICDSDGVSILDNYGAKQVICPHPIAPVRRFVNVDTGEEHLEIWFSKYSGETGVVSKTIIISKDDIANGILKYAKYGIVVNQHNAKALSSYLMNIEQYNYSTIPEMKSVKRLGWVGTDLFSPYVKEIYFDGEEDFGGMFQAVKSAGSYDLWLDAIKKVRAERTVARFYLASSFASVILKPCNLLPFLVHMWGTSEGGKTVSLMIAASVWANPELGEYVTTYNGTRYAQETTAAFLNNLPLCLDELQIQASQGVKDFDDIIYQLCEGVSKKQGKASGGLRKQQKWRNVILSNGEHTIIKPLSGGGARNRVIEIEAPGKIYSDLVGLCEIITHNYGFAGEIFINWLREPGNIDRVKAMQKDYYHQLQELGATDKQTASASAILTADSIVSEILFKDGNGLTIEDMKKVLLKKDEIDVNLKTYEWLIDYVAANSIHFDGENGKVEIWGETDLEDDGTGTIYIIRSVFDRELKSHGLDSKAFLSWAAVTGRIDHQNGRKDKPKRVSGTKVVTRCVCLKVLKTDESTENIKEIDAEKLPF